MKNGKIRQHMQGSESVSKSDLANQNKDDAQHICMSPAKVNLFLKVLSKRDDGYHNIISIVSPVSIYDVIYFKNQDDEIVTVKDNKNCLPEGHANTIYRAAMLLKKRYGINKGINIYVEKNIPIGSGLGGPSSNAAAVLRELPKLWGLTIEHSDLVEMGKEIGADVPLFLSEGPCIIRGIGEKVSPIKLPRLWYLIIYPDIALKTPDVYGGLKIVLTKDKNDIKLRKNFESVQEVADILENDLEKVAILMCPKIKTLKERLIDAGAFGALMSGSGSSVFGIFKDKEQAKKTLISFGDMKSAFIAHSIHKGELNGYNRYQDFSGRGEAG
ncbi:MAG: 4-(cytidine 5'-diphospho)-2-C-methyl-D-erythritol kinase [Proteobacteria bacterium]|nr:4-(cytidine 5'-diphospho)-2-C-methyl-D-erythritol kinase [Pseudomonadota bacterium]